MTDTCHVRIFCGPSEVGWLWLAAVQDLLPFNFRRKELEITETFLAPKFSKMTDRETELLQRQHQWSGSKELAHSSDKLGSWLGYFPYPL